MATDAPVRSSEPAGPSGPDPEPAVALCTCGHEEGLHEHYRRGTDCGGCDCARFEAVAAAGRGW